MAVEVGALRVGVNLNWDALKSGLRRAGDAVGEFGTRFEGVAQRVGRAGIRIAAAAGGLALTFAAMSIRSAAAAEEIRDAFDASFGDAAASANRWADETAGALRLSEAAIREQATSFQNLFSEITDTNEAAASFSQTFVELANDFAALKNIAPERAIELFRNAIAGNVRGMRAYGADLSETRIQQAALAAGIITSNQELSQQQRSLVIASLLMQQYGDATGETARQADDHEASQQMLRMEYENSSEALGNNLIPVMTQLNRAFAGLAGLLSESIAGWRALGSENNFLTRTFVRLRLAMEGRSATDEELNAAFERHISGAGRAAQAEDGLRNQTDAGTDAIDAQAEALLRSADNLENQTARTGANARTWAERHEHDIQRIVGSYDAVQGALREYNEDIEIARRAGLDMDMVQRGLAMQFIESAGGVRALVDRLEELPAPIRALAEELLPKLAEEAGTTTDHIALLAQEINERFPAESRV